MAVSDFAPGTIVYGAYNPRRLGVVELAGIPVTVDFGGFGPLTMPDQGVQVLWEDGARTVEYERALSSFDVLISDHQRKLQNHLDRRVRLERKLGLPPRP